LELVRSWIVDLSSGRGRAALIEGEPGIGKSSLIRAAVAEARAANCQVYWATCDELSQAFPLLPLLEALDGRVNGRPRIANLLRADAPPGNRVDTVAAATERLLALVDDLCARAPVMLVVDDLQWADPATVVLLGRLARSLCQLPLLLIGINRPVPRREDVSAFRRAVEPDALLTLHNLTDDDVAELVASVVGGPPGARLLQLAADAGGNPLYLTELVDALARGRILTVTDGLVDATSGPTPESLSAAIADRLEFLSGPTRDAIRAAALLGLDFSVSDLAMVSGRRVSDLLPLLDEAILAGVLLDNGSQLAFRHPLIQASLYEGMPVAVRAAWHRDAARALAESGAPAERVARQLLPTVDPPDGAGPVEDWVVCWLADAGQHLVGHAPKVAIPLLRWAVAGIPAGVTPHDVLTCRLADALYRVGDPVAAAEVALGALSYANRPDILVDLHWTLTQCRSFAGRSEESLSALQRALNAPGVEPKHRARLLVLTARTYRSLGQIDAASQVGAEALEAAVAAGDHWATAWALGGLTLTYGSRGEPERALPLFDQALAVAEGDPALADLRLLLQINQAVALGNLDCYDAAIGAAEQVRQQADDSGNVIRLAQAQSALGELLFDVGRWDDALAELDAVFGTPTDPAVECNNHGLVATIQLHRGDSEARRHLVAAERYVGRLGDRIAGPLALARSLDWEQSHGPAEALAMLQAWLCEPKDIEETRDLLAAAVRLAVTVGDTATADTLAAQAEAGAECSNVPHRKAIAAHCRGLLDKDPDQLVDAAKHYHEAGRLLPQAQALEAAGVALAERGDTAGARTRFTESFTLYESLNAGWDLARTQATFRGYGIRRGPHVQHRKPHHGWKSLTPTEMKVVGLVAQGMSNPQIANHLFLSRRTVQTHVSHILAKLNLQSRIDIAREASKRED
jgi:DNA-binding NarL/FixJ family response regulator